MKQYKISVTQDDINIGLQRSNTACPIAYAINKAIFAASGINVNAHVNRDGVRICKTLIELPIEVHNFMLNFDLRFGRRTPKPFKFNLGVCIRLN